MTSIQIPGFSRANKIARSDYTFRHVCPSLHPSVYLSVRMEQLGSHWMDFHEISYLSIFRNPVEKI